MDTMVLLFFVAWVLCGVLGSVGPPRWVRLRGAERWTDAADAQQRHLDHWGRGKEPETEEDEE